MKTSLTAQNFCGRQEQLVTYLYEEASPAERADFERHLGACPACRDELQAFRGVRQELTAWQVPVAPRINVVVPRSAWDALREFFGLLPGWVRLSGGLGTATAMALVLLAVLGTHVSFKTGGFEIGFGRQAAGQPGTIQPGGARVESSVATQTITRDEAQRMISEAVARAQSQSQAETRWQLVNLEGRLTAAHRAELAATTARLRGEHESNLKTVLAKLSNRQKPTLSEWLFAANENSEPTGEENEKSNEE